MSYFTIEAIKQKNRNIGHCFFSKSTMKFFKSIIHDAIYKGKYFITSEREPRGDRRFTVRVVNESGSISRVSDFGDFKYKYQAEKFIELLPE